MESDVGNELLTRRNVHVFAWVDGSNMVSLERRSSVVADRKPRYLGLSWERLFLTLFTVGIVGNLLFG